MSNAHNSAYSTSALAITGSSPSKDDHPLPRTTLVGPGLVAPPPNVGPSSSESSLELVNMCYTREWSSRLLRKHRNPTTLLRRDARERSMRRASTPSGTAAGHAPPHRTCVRGSVLAGVDFAGWRRLADLYRVAMADPTVSGHGPSSGSARDRRGWSCRRSSWSASRRGTC